MSNARELVALRHQLATHLRPEDLTRIAWPAVTNHAKPALDRGWTGRELAECALLGAYSPGVTDPIAYVVAAIRDLAQTDPPRDITPTPPPFADVRDQLRPRQPAANAANMARPIDRTRRRGRRDR